MTDQPNYCDRVLGVPHTAVDHDACERRRIDALKAKPTVTVSGNGITVYRLDEQGNPVGEGLSLDTAVSLNLVGDDTADAILDAGMDFADRTFTMDLEMCRVDPNLIALLYGGKVAPYEVWGSTRLYRWLPRFIKRRLKSRWIRRAYSG